MYLLYVQGEESIIGTGETWRNYIMLPASHLMLIVKPSRL